MNLSIKDKLLFYIIILLGCQQFPVIRIGGSFKTYELLGIVLMIYSVLYINKTYTSRQNIYALLFFIVVPVISYVYSSAFYEYPYGFYARYPGSLDFKTNYYLFPLLQLFLLAINFFVYSALINTQGIYIHFHRLIRASILIGTIIAAYSIMAMFFWDPISQLPSFIQFKRHYNEARSTGLSQEPGTYVLYQAWICLFVFYSKFLYSKTKWRFIMVINLLSLLFTFATGLLGLLLIVIFGFFTFKGSAVNKRKAFFGFSLFVFVIYVGVVYFNYAEAINNYFFKKIETFFLPHQHDTLNSGGMRNYTTSIGLRIFEDYPFLGVGDGRSIYYMYLYEYKMGIYKWGERMISTSTPQNMYAVILAEQGIVGFTILSVFYGSIIWKFWVNRNKSGYHKMFLMGGLFVFVVLFTLWTPYHMFIWSYLGLGIGYIKFFDKQNSLIKSNANN